MWASGGHKRARVPLRIPRRADLLIGPSSPVPLRAMLDSHFMPLPFQPMPLRKRRLPFDDPAWLFALKLDGCRALAVIENGRAQLFSRNGHPFAGFTDLCRRIAAGLPDAEKTVLTFKLPLAQKLWREIFSPFQRAPRAELVPMLAGTWAGEALDRMEKHFLQRQAAVRQRSEFENPEALTRRREEKRRPRNSDMLSDWKRRKSAVGCGRKSTSVKT